MAARYSAAAPGQPQQSIRGMGAARRIRCGRPATRGTSGARRLRGIAARRAGGICRRASRGIHPHQVHGVLKLVAEAVGAAGLVEPPPRPDPLGQAPDTSANPSGDPSPGCWFRTRTVSIRLRHHSWSRRDLPGPTATSRYLRTSAAACCRSSAWPSTTATVHSPWAGISSVVSRPAIGRSSSVGAASGSPVSTKARVGHVPAGSEEAPPPRFHPLRGPRHGHKRRPAAVTVARILEEQGPERLVMAHRSGPACSGWSANTIWK